MISVARPGCIALALCAFFACSRAEPDTASRVDLLEIFPHTPTAQERGRIDLGTPDGDLLLLDGWSPGGRLPDGTSVATAVDRRASLRFAIAEPGELRLRLRLGPIEQEPSSGRFHPQPVIVSLNQNRVGALRVGDEAAAHDLTLPVRAQRTGENVLLFEHPTLVPPGIRRPGRSRHTGVPYDWIDVTGADGSAAARPHLASPVTRDALVLPPGTRSDFFLRTSASRRLDFAFEPGPGDKSTAIRVSLALDGAAADEHVVYAATVGPGERRRVSVDLDPGESEIVRLSFASGGPASTILFQPEVRGPAAAIDSRSASSAAPGAADAEASPAAAATRPNILLYVIDTLRADHLGCYGYARATSPHVDRLARDGVVFTQAIAHAPWTRPAMASILTGLLPQAHGANTLRRGIRPGVATLAEILANGGYETAAFVTNVNVSGPLGFDRGFATFRYLPEDATRESRHVLSDELNRSVLEWLGRPRARPFFLYVHASDPHAPYTPPADLAARFRLPGSPESESAPSPADLRATPRHDTQAPTAERIAGLIAAYDAEIAFNDRSVGELLDALVALGLDQSTLVVLTGDHGEEFGDHGGLDHGHTLFDELIRVPLVLRVPGGDIFRGQVGERGTRRATLARHIDLMPTMLDLVGVARPAGLPGRSLLTPLDAEAERSLEAISHTSFGPNQLSAVVTPRWKVVQDLSGRRHDRAVEVFDLRTDPRERKSVAAERPALVGYARQVLSRAASERPQLAPGKPAGEAPAIDAETERRLRALGYVD